jgi:uncharacterized BrkB/YihY/UPF0761 family membrane protein
MKSSRMLIAVLLTLFGVAFGAVAVVAAYGQTRLLAAPTFADRVVSSLDNDDVQSMVSGKLNAVVVERGGPAVDTPTVHAAIRRVVASPALKRVARTQTEAAVRRVTGGSNGDFFVDLQAALPLLITQLQKVDPDRAAMLSTIRRAVDWVRIVAIVAPILSALLLVVGFVIAPRRKLLLAWTGLLTTAVALTGLFAMQRLRSTALDRVPNETAAYGAIWDIFVEGLRTWWILALGIGVFALVVGLVRPVRR